MKIETVRKDRTAFKTDMGWHDCTMPVGEFAANHIGEEIEDLEKDLNIVSKIILANSKGLGKSEAILKTAEAFALKIPDTGRQILRMNCNQRAIELVTLGLQNKTISESDIVKAGGLILYVFNVSRTFENWVIRNE